MQHLQGLEHVGDLHHGQGKSSLSRYDTCKLGSAERVKNTWLHPSLWAAGLPVRPPGHRLLQRLHVLLGRHLPGVLEEEDGHAGSPLGLHGLPWGRGLTLKSLSVQLALCCYSHSWACFDFWFFCRSWLNFSTLTSHWFICPHVDEVFFVHVPPPTSPARSVHGQSSQPWPPPWSPTRWPGWKSPTSRRRPGCPAWSLAPWSSSWWWGSLSKRASASAARLGSSGQVIRTVPSWQEGSEVWFL